MLERRANDEPSIKVKRSGLMTFDISVGIKVYRSYRFFNPPLILGCRTKNQNLRLICSTVLALDTQRHRRHRIELQGNNKRKKRLNESDECLSGS